MRANLHHPVLALILLGTCVFLSPWGLRSLIWLQPEPWSFDQMLRGQPLTRALNILLDADGLGHFANGGLV